jgi:UDPglucose 6-dehydrogenase
VRLLADLATGGDLKVVIYGTGYVGLTAGAAFAYLGHSVTCVDIDEEKVQALQQGKTPIYEPHLDQMLAAAQGNLEFTTDGPKAIAEADVIFIAVGTPPLDDGGPDLSSVEAAARAVGENLQGAFTVVVNKSTVPIGSTRWVDSAIREAYAAKHGGQLNGSFAVCSNPEFLRQGAAIQDILYPDRVVVGCEDKRAFELMYALYRPILEQSFSEPTFLPRPKHLHTVPLISTDPASAELIKYAANAFLSVKISFINEMAALAERVGADVTQVAKGIGLDRRIGSRFLQAGLGWGGSCFGKDSAALVSAARQHDLEMPIVEAARRINYELRQRVVEKLLGDQESLEGKTVALLGLTFKPHTDDLRDSPALEVAERLLERGAKVKVHDPVAMERAKRERSDLDLHYCETPCDAAEGADAIVLATDWPEYAMLPWQQIAESMEGATLVDGRNFLNKSKVEQAGFAYMGMGR